MRKNRSPTMSANPGIPTLPKNILLGKSMNSDVEWIPSQAGHILVSGGPGSGKTVFLQNLAEQCRLNNWLVLVADGNLDKTDSWFPGRNIDTATDIVAVIHMLDEVLSIMRSRLSLMDEERVNNYAELKQPLFPILVVIDGVDNFLKNDEVDPYLYPDDLYANQLQTLLFSITRISRAAGIHFAVSHTESIRYPNRSRSELENFSVQVVTDTNSMDKEDVLFGKEIPSLPSALDRGWISFFNRDDEVQLYWPVA